VGFQDQKLARFYPDQKLRGLSSDLGDFRRSIPYPQPLRLLLNLKII
jgi:hypothetical protein